MYQCLTSTFEDSIVWMSDCNGDAGVERNHQADQTGRKSNHHKWLASRNIPNHLIIAPENTHTHTHTRTHACTHARTHTHIYTVTLTNRERVEKKTLLQTFITAAVIHYRHCSFFKGKHERNISKPSTNLT